MSPDKFFLIQFLVFVVWIAALLWVPYLNPTSSAAGVVPIRVTPPGNVHVLPPGASVSPPSTGHVYRPPVADSGGSSPSVTPTPALAQPVAPAPSPSASPSAAAAAPVVPAQPVVPASPVMPAAH